MVGARDASLGSFHSIVSLREPNFTNTDITVKCPLFYR